jgi:hypothetical protein
VGVIGAAPALTPDVVVTLEEVTFCGGKIEMTWGVQNNKDDGAVVLPLTSDNIVVWDGNNEYRINDDQSKPTAIQVAPGQQARGTAVIDRPVSLSTSTLKIMLRHLPFGEAVWVVPIKGS